MSDGEPDGPRIHRPPRKRKKIIRPARQRKGLLARGEYVLFLSVYTFFRLLPFRLAFRLGEAVGILAYWVDRRRRDIGMINLTVAFPARGDAERRRILKESFRNLGRLLAEFCHLRYVTSANIRDRVEVEDEDNWRRLEERIRGTGALILTGHFGNWELFARAAACYGMPMHIVHRQLRNVFVEAALTKERERGGATVIKKTTAVLEVFRAIKQKNIVVAAVDQNASGRMGVFVPFFSVPASTSSGLAGLALTTKVPVVPAFLVRINGSWKHKIVILPLIEPIRSGNQEEDLIATTEKFTAIFQAMVEKYPEHWLWIHKRWKRRPDGAPALYT